MFKQEGKFNFEYSMSGAMKWFLQLFSDLSFERLKERIKKSWTHMKYGITGERRRRRKKNVDGMAVLLLTERLMIIAIIILLE